MSRVQRMLLALGMALALPAFSTASTPQASSSQAARGSGPDTRVAALNGTWRSAPDETPLSSPFDESVWGKDAKAVRTVDLQVRPTGQATLTINRRVVDARGRTVAGSPSIELAELVVGPVQEGARLRMPHEVTVTKAERRYPDDPQATWVIQGLQVGVTSFTDDPEMLEVRVDFPEGRGSFWEALHRGTRRSSTAR